MSRDSALPVIVATNTAEALSVFVRGTDGGLVQTGQLRSARDVDAATLASIVADLSDTFGWSDAIPTNGHKPRKALPAPTQPELQPTEPERPSNHPAGKHGPYKVPPDHWTRRPRRGHAAMAALTETVYEVLAAFPRDKWPGTGEVHRRVVERMAPERLHDSATNRALHRLVKSGRAEVRTITNNFNRPAYLWHAVK